MKKTIFLSCAMAFTTIAGFAQQAGAPGPKGGQTVSVDERAKQQTDKLSAAVQLSPDQYTKVLEAMKNYMTQRQALRANGAMGDDAKAKMKALNEERDAKMKTILSADQWKKAEEMRQEMHEQHKGQ
jgi:hypothetical protein